MQQKNSNMDRLFRQKWFWQGAVTCVKTLPWYLHSDIGTTSDPNVETFETFWMVWNHAKKQKKKDPSIFQWHFVAAIQTCVVYSFTPPIFTHETSVWLWYLTYQSLMILNLVPCNIVLRKLSQNHLVDKYNRNLNFTHAFSQIQLKFEVSITTLKPTGFHISHQDFQSNNMLETNWNQTTQLRKKWSYHLSPLGQPAWSEDSAWIHC